MYMLTLYFLGRLEVPNTAWVCTYCTCILGREGKGKGEERSRGIFERRRRRRRGLVRSGLDWDGD